MYSRLYTDTVELLGNEYTRAVAEFDATADRGQGPRDEREQLGEYVAWAHLLGLGAEREGDWLNKIVERAPDWLRADVLRWIAEQGADSDTADDVRSRAKTFPVSRVLRADPAAVQQELEAVSWFARSEDRAAMDIVLPALEKSGGRTENGQGVAELAARVAPARPVHAARTLQLLVQGDRWRSLPHLARDPLRRGLEIALGSGQAEALTFASEAINRLGAQGFLEFRDLLPPTESAA